MQQFSQMIVASEKSVALRGRLQGAKNAPKSRTIMVQLVAVDALEMMPITTSADLLCYFTTGKAASA